MVHTMAHEEETLPAPAPVIGIVLVLAIAVVLVTFGWLSCELLLPARPFTY
jgi:hypothetical protein